MAITFSGDDGIKFTDGTVKGSAVIGFHQIGSYVFADVKNLPTAGQDIPWGVIARGDELYGSDRAGSRDPNPVSTAETLWQCCGFSITADRASLSFSYNASCTHLGCSSAQS